MSKRSDVIETRQTDEVRRSSTPPRAGSELREHLLSIHQLNDKSDKIRLRWYQFSLASLLALTVFASILFASIVHIPHLAIVFAVLAAFALLGSLAFLLWSPLLKIVSNRLFWCAFIVLLVVIAGYTYVVLESRLGYIGASTNGSTLFLPTNKLAQRAKGLNFRYQMTETLQVEVQGFPYRDPRQRSEPYVTLWLTVSGKVPWALDPENRHLPYRSDEFRDRLLAEIEQQLGESGDIQLTVSHPYAGK